jgi:DinB superfamily
MEASGAVVPSPAEILRGLEESQAEVLRAAAALSGEDWDRGRYEGSWNARQLLAHIASIEWSYPRIIDLARQARAGTGDGVGRFRGGNDAYNERQVAMRAGVPVEALIDEFRRNRNATVEAVLNADQAIWATPIRSAGGFEGPLARVFWEVAVEHVRNHARDMAGGALD